MYLECIRCPKLGKSCDGPNFVAMPPDKLIAWTKERKKHLGFTNAQLAEMSNMAQGTIDSLLAGKQADFKFGTIQPILRALVGSEWSGDPCPNPEGVLDAELRAEIAQLKTIVAQQEKRAAEYVEEIALLRKHNEKTAEEMQKTAERQADTRSFLQAQISVRNRALVVMGVLLSISVLALIFR